MGDTYYELTEFSPVADVNEFTFDRTRSIFAALQQQRDYSVQGLLKRADRKVECIVVDVESDGVPPRNIHGIKYRERLALCILENEKQLVEVYALRKDFPILMHQNLSPPDAPRSLCLYFEPPASVTRSWTPQKFLRRIQSWLEKSAKGEIHPADQPVEQLFFASKYELVLPWNFDELKEGKDNHTVIVAGPERPGEGLTCFLKPLQVHTKPPKGTVKHIEFTLPPIVHGHIEYDPTTLGVLADILTRHGIDILPDLQKALRDGVDEKGVPESADNSLTAILLHIPMARTEATLPEKFFHRAFMVPCGVRHLGLLTGAIVLVEVPEGRRSLKKYFSGEGVLGDQRPTQWRDEAIYPMEVLRQNDTSSARRQSGISGNGPAGVLVGAGSLGSALLNIWGRSGWGRWIVIDNDHIKPHNLSRHTALAIHIGQPKATVVAELHDAVMEGASGITPLYADACDLSQESVTNALTSAQLTIDASTTLEYPRIMSGTEKVGRHISVFITPRGTDAVLLAEDEQRHIRLRTLEAQYYRALIHESWGQNHLDDNLGSFWSGASCRDMSTVLPYSKVLSHASILAEQIPIMAASPRALIRVWQRDPERSSLAVHDVTPAQEIHMDIGKMALFIDSGIVQQLCTWRNGSLPNETGGVLLGYYDFNVSSVTIVTALPAPTDSKSSPGGFERGIVGLEEAVREASRRTAGIVGYIGEWHSHPPRHSASPSKADLIQLCDLARGMAEDGLPAVQLIVGENDVRILHGAVDQ